MKAWWGGRPLLWALLFLAYGGLLIWINYSTQIQLRESALTSLKIDAEKRAAAISYFFAERRNDLQDLAESREVAAFFANQVLQMSMEYGLRANLLAIRDSFERIRVRKTLGSRPIYRHILLLGADGTVLAETAGTAPPTGNLARFLTPPDPGPMIVIDRSANAVVTSAPVIFKGAHAGQLLAWSDASELQSHFVEQSDPAKHYELVLSPEGEPVLPVPGSLGQIHAMVASARTVPVGQVQLVRIGGDDGPGTMLAMAKQPIAGTSFSLVTLVPEAALYRATPVPLLVAAGSVPIIVLAAALGFGRLRRANQSLKSRYLESTRKRGELEGRFTALEEEVHRREAVESELREQRGQLEARTRELQAAMEEAHHLAMYDGLTGLSNRVLFRDSLRRSIDAAQRHGTSVAVLFLDVDRFKRINDTLGHTAGDLLLREVAGRIERCIRPSDALGRAGDEDCVHCVARQGGDEFTVLLTELADPLQAGNVARRIIDTLARPLQLEGHEVVVTGSVGISLYPGDGHDPDTLLKNADAAMYSAKERGRNQYQFYQSSMHATAMRRLALENEMRQAVAQGEFDVFYQPMVDSSTRRLVGTEALVRWHHPTRGLVSPGEFIPVAEESGLIVPITEFVISRACRQVAEWTREAGYSVPVSVNLSGRALELADVAGMIEGALKEAGIGAGMLEVELTESVLMEGRRNAQELLARLKQAGTRVSIDDFGTGYSSLSCLKTFPIDTLKIDRSFVLDLPSDPNDAAIVCTIIAMAATLNLRVVAEGVETVEQFAFLRGVGCTLVQGFLFGRPGPAEEITKMMLRTLTPAGLPTDPSVTGAAIAGNPNRTLPPRAISA